MATSSKERNRLIGFSYIRLNCDEINTKYSTSLRVPKEIIFIIIEYFQNLFEWDHQKCSQDMIISNDNLTIKSAMDGNRTFLAKNLLSSDEFKKVNWEITMRDLGDRRNYLYIAMGYVEYQQDIKKSVSRYEVTWLGENEYQCSIFVDGSESSLFKKYHRGLVKTVKYDPVLADDVLNGTFEIRFDFIQKKCSFYYNGKFVATFHDELPEKLYPAMSCYGVHKFECTKWELFYDKH